MGFARVLTCSTCTEGEMRDPKNKNRCERPACPMKNILKPLKTDSKCYSCETCPEKEQPKRVM